MRIRPLANALLLGATVLLGAAVVAPRVMQPDTEAWTQQQLQSWTEDGAPEEVLEMRRWNPEWDFMARTFLSLTLAERALTSPETQAEALGAMDRMIADTLAQEAAHGQRWYLMDYADARPWEGDGRSLFVDGEVLVMMGARRALSPDRWGPEMATRAAQVSESFGAASPLPFAESYPDEGWTFCHSLAMVGLRMHEVIDGADHSAVTEAWMAAARTTLIDPETGMLVSEFDMQGRHHDGPEGSSIWLSLTALRLLDPVFAQDQYSLARDALGRELLGWGYALEWPESAQAQVDVDSGPIVPILNASASSSGFAILAARAFGDEAWSQELEGALGAAQVVMAIHPTLAQAADNPVGQSVILWGLHFGPLWDRLSAPSPRPAM